MNFIQKFFSASLSVEKLKAKGDIHGLIKALSYRADGNEPAREAAAKALGEFKDARAIGPLIAALVDKPSELHVAALEALVKIGSPAVEPLIDALNDSDQTVREFAVMALGKIKDPRCVEPLIAAFKDSHPYVRREAVSRFIDLLKDPRAFEPLVSALEDNDECVRGFAVIALGRSDDARAVEPLIVALKDQGPFTRGNAARALGEIKDPRAVEPLIAALKDRDHNVLRYAAEALGELKDGRAVEPLLVVALYDSKEDVRKRAAEALEKIGSPEAMQALALQKKATCVSAKAEPVAPLTEFGYRFTGSDWEDFTMDPSMTFKLDPIQQYDCPKTFFEGMSMGAQLGLFPGSPDKACIIYSEKYPIGDGFKVLCTVNSRPPHSMMICIGRHTIRDFHGSDRCLAVVREHFYVLRI